MTVPTAPPAKPIAFGTGSTPATSALPRGRGVVPPTVNYCHQPCNQEVDYTSQLEPYGLYGPDKPAPPQGYGMTLNLHFYTGNYNNGPPDAQQLADRGTGSLVLTPEGRGLCFWYWSEPGADVFEAWADAGRHFHLDPTYNAISGWSMGGYGTYKITAEYPDLFAVALPDIGCVSAETGWPGEPTPSISGEDAEILNLVGSFRNIPFLMATPTRTPYVSTAMTGASTSASTGRTTRRRTSQRHSLRPARQPQPAARHPHLRRGDAGARVGP